MIPGAGVFMKAVGGRAGIVAIGLFALLLALGAFAIRTGLSTIEDQSRKIAQLETDLATEQNLRASDVAGLTTLVDGLVVNTRKSAEDQGAIEYALDKAHPSPLSPFMRAYFECLRAHRSGAKDCATLAASAAEPAGAQ